ncbi:MAG: hypothetical protein HYY18_18610 [Planctomycetes bacterium]|nr:hypothetical protein [Planctomycetota bacterium]
MVITAENAYFFRHAVLRDAAYQLQMPGERSQLHRLALEAIEALCGGRPPELPLAAEPGGCEAVAHASDPFAEELAEHGRRAEAPGAEAGPVRAARRIYLKRAAELAERSFRLEPAFRAWGEVAEILDETEKAHALGKAGVQAHFAAKPQVALQFWE